MKIRLVRTKYIHTPIEIDDVSDQCAHGMLANFLVSAALASFKQS